MSLTHDEAMAHIRRSVSIQRAADYAKVNREVLVRSLDHKLPFVKAAEQKEFLRKYLTDRFDEYFRRINKRTATSVVFWHKGKIREGHHEVINSLRGVEVIGYYDFEIRVKDLLDDLLAEVYDKTGESYI